MSTLELIKQIRNDGCLIVMNGPYLDISPADNLKPELANQIKQKKAEILCALHREKELTRLVNRISNYYGFTKERHSRVLMAALSDQANAIICFATLAHRAELL